ncbi:ABC transporter ATP-binding protein [uncultured Vagococcus sp.]|uniref:ABC transporter ATP-binding protein n=1 Tax=uncultured Vagococcus sp. TaxID=189676 RepID=UPI0028D3C696|nr:ABC transporter ATP-binding protein [uncultured Vagococcus sp.]
MGTVKTEQLNKSLLSNGTSINLLEDISLDIGKGLTAINGPSGSGKSTLLNIIGGLDRATSGLVQVNGMNLATLDEEGLASYRRRHIGFIFRNYNLLPVLNVYENITFPLELDSRLADREYIMQIASLLQIEDKMSLLPNILSGGEKQKVAIARALAIKPALILADEPTGSLDSFTSLEVIGLLKMTIKEFNQAVVIVTHDQEIAELADRIIHLRDGRVERIDEKRKKNN